MSAVTGGSRTHVMHAAAALLVAGLLRAAAAEAAVAAAAPAVDICASLPPCRAQASVVSGPSFAITQGACAYRYISARFMTGCQVGCGGMCVPACEAPNLLHVPETSPAVDLHRDLDENQRGGNSRFYLDERMSGGEDRHSRLGIDSVNVVFSVGHGAPHSSDPEDDYLNVMGPRPDVLLSRVRVGDGEARYLLLASCQVMSHGPLSCSRAHNQFACPQEFDVERWQSDPMAHRNVFARWEPRIAPGLRMACAGSSLMFPGPEVSDSFWQHYRVLSRPVADSILMAMAATPDDVPLCMTHGARAPARTPLFDQRFTADRNRRIFPGPFLHIMYPVHGGASAVDLQEKLLSALEVTARPTTDVEPPPPDWRPPILELPDLPSLPPGSQPAAFGFQQLPPHLLSPFGAAARGLTAQVHPGSGAVILRWSPHPRALSGVFGPQLRRLPLAKNWPALAAQPAVTVTSLTLRIDRVRRRKARSAAPECFEACRYVRLQKWLSLPGPSSNIEVPLIGPGAEWVLASCPGGNGSSGGTDGGDCPAAGRDELTFTFDVRPPGQPRSQRDLGIVLPPDFDPLASARERARLELERQGFHLDGRGENAAIERGSPRIVYETPPVHCTQRYLFPFLRFTYEIEVEPRHGNEPHELAIDVPYYPGFDGRAAGFRSCSPEPPSR